VARGLLKITVTEVDQQRLAHREALAGDARVAVSEINLDERMVGSYSSLVSFTVLEHLPNDIAPLNAVKKLVKPGGYVN